MGSKKKKAASVFIRLVSAAGTGFFYVKKKNPRKILEKLEFRKFDPRVNRHVLFTEAKMKCIFTLINENSPVKFDLKTAMQYPIRIIKSHIMVEMLHLRMKTN
ncbi:hypothetical protein SAY87_023718 [Trapa incisa]|uniref:50S ribosomal protein L33, chloroplastic n=2 Tax=Trapa TaxID=22665 RepID=A0AAN7QRK5_9MYRT|nr:hypothetical protein SAY87_023718 [Trapa incisa]